MWNNPEAKEIQNPERAPEKRPLFLLPCADRSGEKLEISYKKILLFLSIPSYFVNLCLRKNFLLDLAFGLSYNL